MKVHPQFGVGLIVLLMAGTSSSADDVITFNDDGGWCWFEDERAIVRDDKLIIGTIAQGRNDASRKGNVEIVTYDLRTAEAHRVVLHQGLQGDDHDSPALLARGDGRLLAMYCRHGRDNRIYYRISEAEGDGTRWRDERVFVPSPTSRVTYSNLFRLTAENDGKGRIYNFYRGYDNHFKPSWMTSDDDGETWVAQGLWIDFPSPRRHRPYVKYASDARDTIHFVFTEAHPRDFDNSIYHAFYRGGVFHRSDGAPIKPVRQGPITPAQATRVFAGDAANVAWTSDLELDEDLRPVVVYSVQKDTVALDRADRLSGQDHRYRYARWDGQRWHDHQIAYAGTRLYPGEDDYTGNICIDPDNPAVVYLSSNVNIHDGGPNASGRYEIYRGVTNDLGASWSWTAITTDSMQDNIRPIVPKWNSKRTALLWLRGRYRSYTDYDLQVVGMVIDQPD